MSQTVNQPFTMVLNSVLFDTRLSALTVRLVAALEDFSGNNRTCWPGYEALAKKVGCSARWIPYLLKKLVKAGLVVIQYRHGKTNIYTLLARVVRRKPAPVESSPPPMKPDNYEQKPTTKTNNNRAYRRLNQSKKGNIVFDKYLPGGIYEAAVIS